MNPLLINTMKHPTTNPSLFFVGSVLKKSTPGKFNPIWYLKPAGILFHGKVFAAIAVFVKPKLPDIRRATSHKSGGHAGEQEQKQSFLNSSFMQIIPKNIVPPTWPLCRVVEGSNKPRLQVFWLQSYTVFHLCCKRETKLSNITKDIDFLNKMVHLAINRIAVLNETVTYLLIQTI